MSGPTTKSPYFNVSDATWALAYEDACITLGEKGVEREPSIEEIDAALDARREEKTAQD